MSSYFAPQKISSVLSSNGKMIYITFWTFCFSSTVTGHLSNLTSSTLEQQKENIFIAFRHV